MQPTNTDVTTICGGLCEPMCRQCHCAADEAAEFRNSEYQPSTNNRRVDFDDLQLRLSLIVNMIADFRARGEFNADYGGPLMHEIVESLELCLSTAKILV